MKTPHGSPCSGTGGTHSSVTSPHSTRGGIQPSSYTLAAWPLHLLWTTSVRNRGRILPQISQFALKEQLWVVSSNTWKYSARNSIMLVLKLIFSSFFRLTPLYLFIFYCRIYSFCTLESITEKTTTNKHKAKQNKHPHHPTAHPWLVLQAIHFMGRKKPLCPNSCQIHVPGRVVVQVSRGPHINCISPKSKCHFIFHRHC